MITNNSKISFVMPAFNCADTIEEAVDSIFNGNFEEGDEVIIVNDASMDDTKRIIEQLKSEYPTLIVITNPINKGCPASRNVGIRLAANPLIFNLDADDILVPGSVGRLKECLIENSADVAAFSESRFFRDKNKAVTHKWVIKPGVLTLADYLAGPIVPGGNFVYTKASWERIGGYWEYGKGLHEFWGFSLKQLANGSKFVVLPDSYYLHRYGTDSLFMRENKKKEESSLMATKMITHFIHLLDPRDAEYIQSEDGSRTWFEHLSKEHPIRLKTGELGRTGCKVSFKKNNSLISLPGRIAHKIAEGLLSYAQGLLKYQSFFERMFIFALRGMNYGGGTNPEDSGEIHVLNYVKNKFSYHDSPIVIFDVGANIGEYTSLIQNIVQKVVGIKIYSFEPSQNTFRKLEDNIGSKENISLFNFGFGKTEAKLTLFSDSENSGLASLYHRKLDHFDIKMDIKEVVEIKTIDDFCLKQHVDRIHFLKLDIEGNELNALRGAEQMLRDRKIDCIQFEFGGSNIDSRTYFQDFFYLLNPTYNIYRIVKDGLYPIENYKETLEIFITTNYFAELRNP